MKKILLLFLGFLSAVIYGQSTITITDAANSQPLKNVVVNCGNTILGTTDSAGKLDFKSSCKTVKITLPGYFQENIIVEPKMSVQLSKKEQGLGGIETVVLEDVSDPKALSLLDQVLENILKIHPKVFLRTNSNRTKKFRWILM